MFAEGYERLELSTQILIKEAKNRKIEVEILDWSDNFIRLQRDNNTEYVKQATKTSADTYISTLIMENKEVTKIVLKENGINVPQGIVVQTVEAGMESDFLLSDQDVVVKPKSTNFGEGVVILKRPFSPGEYQSALKSALGYDDSVLIEKFISGREFRFLVIGSEVAAVLHRVPANVIGDGEHTIEELVKIKNENPLRGRGYVTPLEKINLGTIEKSFLQLHNKDFHTIPQSEEIVYLRENSNISTGGDSIDFTDRIIDKYKDIAVQSAKAVDSKICGVDMIIQDIHTKPNNKNYSIIELNFNPALHIHNFPYQGQNRFVEKKVLDLLGFV